MDDYQKKMDIRRKENIQHQRNNSHNKLKDDVKKKMKTTMIGAIAAVETNFGYLWGFNKDEQDLTEQEKEFGEVWEIIRQEILDKGNSQIRAILDELDNYSVQWERYNYKFTF